MLNHGVLEDYSQDYDKVVKERKVTIATLGSLVLKTIASNTMLIRHDMSTRYLH